MKTKPKLTTISYSGGTQSEALVRMVLLGIIPRPKNLIVVNADPGMENTGSYDAISRTFADCRAVGIECVYARGPNLLNDLTAAKTNVTRLDNPPYWTKDEKGKRGQLRQSCTKAYKISPMQRAVRLVLAERFKIPVTTKRLGNDIVETWIGFSADEQERVKESKRKFEYFRFPLIELGYEKADVAAFYATHNLRQPPRSLCNACFAHGLRSLKEMHDTRPADWAQAVAVDESIRDLSCTHVKLPCFVSDTLIPLRELAERDFKTGDKYTDLMHQCNSGACFV